jgi:transcriptional regulator with XRE-family HTH domain
MMDLWCVFKVLMDDRQRQKLVDLIVEIKGDRSQSRFARDLGVSLGAVQGWLAGGLPSVDNLEKIAVAAGMTLEELIVHIWGANLKHAPKVAEDVLQNAVLLDVEQRRRLIHLLIDTI